MKVIEDMKKDIKKKKAFTLIELMGVLVIIGVLATILIPVISNSIKNNKEKIYQVQLQNIVLAAKNFGSDNIDLLPKDEEEYINITLGQLMMAGYIDFDIVNPKTKTVFPECLKIKIQKINNNYDYIVDEESIKNCENESVISDAQIAVSLPDKQYIKNQDEVSYILVVKPLQESQISSYNLDSTKISLGEVSGATYYVDGGNGNYKITVVGGPVEETIELNLNDGAITDDSGKIVDTSKLEFGTLIVDNTAPIITFGQNGNSDWEIAVASAINVTDARSGGNASTYKYEFDTSTQYVDGYSFSDGETISSGQGWEGEYYIKATACDKVGNCIKETSNAFKIDSEPPAIPTVSLVYSGTNTVYDNVWTTNNITTNLSSVDYGIGGVYYQYSDDDSWAWMDMNNFSTDKEGEYNRHFRACDALNNCSYPTSDYWIGIDRTSPSITLNSNNALAWVGDKTYLENTSSTYNSAYFQLVNSSGILGIETGELFSCSDNSDEIIRCDNDIKYYDHTGVARSSAFFLHPYGEECMGSFCQAVVTINAMDYAGNTQQATFTYYVKVPLS